MLSISAALSSTVCCRRGVQHPQKSPGFKVARASAKRRCVIACSWTLSWIVVLYIHTNSYIPLIFRSVETRPAAWDAPCWHGNAIIPSRSESTQRSFAHAALPVVDNVFEKWKLPDLVSPHALKLRKLQCCVIVGFSDFRYEILKKRER